ncbi:hypothetical protein DPMN_179224 [Dreissena polymorpha]|uniref:Uncharacterized protein n=1 Tax=Dreissena polymorpha TaxID=45954 RepID=A0A9D4EFN4_DREPO|nr:hypothetical protein DPMN_179224 [Dreissena polymorpha]
MQSSRTACTTGQCNVIVRCHMRQAKLKDSLHDWAVWSGPAIQPARLGSLVRTCCTACGTGQSGQELLYSLRDWAVWVGPAVSSI